MCQMHRNAVHSYCGYLSRKQGKVFSARHMSHKTCRSSFRFFIIYTAAKHLSLSACSPLHTLRYLYTVSKSSPFLSLRSFIAEKSVFSLSESQNSPEIYNFLPCPRILRIHTVMRGAVYNSHADASYHYTVKRIAVRWAIIQLRLESIFFCWFSYFLHKDWFSGSRSPLYNIYLFKTQRISFIYPTNPPDVFAPMKKSFSELCSVFGIYVTVPFDELSVRRLYGYLHFMPNIFFG